MFILHYTFEHAEVESIMGITWLFCWISRVRGLNMHLNLISRAIYIFIMVITWLIYWTRRVRGLNCFWSWFQELSIFYHRNANFYQYEIYVWVSYKCMSDIMLLSSNLPPPMHKSLLCHFWTIIFIIVNR